MITGIRETICKLYECETDSCRRVVSYVPGLSIPWAIYTLSRVNTSHSVEEDALRKRMVISLLGGGPLLALIDVVARGILKGKRPKSLSASTIVLAHTPDVSPTSSKSVSHVPDDPQKRSLDSLSGDRSPPAFSRDLTSRPPTPFPTGKPSSGNLTASPHDSDSSEKTTCSGGTYVGTQSGSSHPPHDAPGPGCSGVKPSYPPEMPKGSFIGPIPYTSPVPPPEAFKGTVFPRADDTHNRNSPGSTTPPPILASRNKSPNIVDITPTTRPPSHPSAFATPLGHKSSESGSRGCSSPFLGSGSHSPEGILSSDHRNRPPSVQVAFPVHSPNPAAPFCGITQPPQQNALTPSHSGVWGIPPGSPRVPTPGRANCIPKGAVPFAQLTRSYSGGGPLLSSSPHNTTSFVPPFHPPQSLAGAGNGLPLPTPFIGGGVSPNQVPAHSTTPFRSYSPGGCPHLSVPACPVPYQVPAGSSPKAAGLPLFVPPGGRVSPQYIPLPSPRGTPFRPTSPSGLSLPVAPFQGPSIGSRPTSPAVYSSPAGSSPTASGLLLSVVPLGREVSPSHTSAFHIPTPPRGRSPAGEKPPV